MLSHEDLNKKPTGTSIDKLLGRYEFSQGSHNKFWECLYHSGEGYDASFVVRWGRIGAKNPQFMFKGFSVYKDVEKKIKKGYDPVMGYPKTESDLVKRSLIAETRKALEEIGIEADQMLSRKKRIM